MATSNNKPTDNFPSKLHYVLREVEKDGQGDIIFWQPHGRAFCVRDKERFSREMLPKWFRQNKYASFQRQLNLYSFRRITSGRDKGSYYHPLFVKNNPALNAEIPRTKVKGKGPRKPAAPETEPDFYAMEFASDPPVTESTRPSVASLVRATRDTPQVASTPHGVYRQDTALAYPTAVADAVRCRMNQQLFNSGPIPPAAYGALPTIQPSNVVPGLDRALLLAALQQQQLAANANLVQHIQECTAANNAAALQRAIAASRITRARTTSDVHNADILEQITALLYRR